MFLWFWSISLCENTFPLFLAWLQFFKHLPFELATFLQREGAMKNWKCRKCLEKTFENNFLLQKTHKKAPSQPKTMSKACIMIPYSPSPFCDQILEDLCKLRQSNWGEIDKKTLRAHISDEMQGKGVLTNWCWCEFKNEMWETKGYRVTQRCTM